MSESNAARCVNVLRDTTRTLAEEYDLAMLDLDGVVYRGNHVVPGAVEALTSAHETSMALAYVTNNASCPPDQVVENLRTMGVPVEDGEVVTSAQAAAHVVESLVPAGARVLVIGGEGLQVALGELGLVPVSRLDDSPAAVVQGFHRTVGWELLAEGAYAVSSGLPWVASNTDMTIPTARGVAPGNGTLVAAIAHASGRQPIVAGKPHAPLFEETLRRVGGNRPLVVGDRLDTDIEGANNVAADSLLVLTGVSTLADVVRAGTHQRPTFIGPDLGALHVSHEPVVNEQDAVRCGPVRVLGTRRAIPEIEGANNLAADVHTATCLLRAAVGWGWRQSSAGARTLDLEVVEDRLREMME